MYDFLKRKGDLYEKSYFIGACGRNLFGFNAPCRLWWQHNKTIATVDDLEGAKIGVQLGTTGDIYASDYEEKGSTVERFNKGADAVLALTQGKIDCVIIDSEPAKAFVAANKGLKILDEPFAEEEYAICVAKDNTDLLGKSTQLLQSSKLTVQQSQSKRTSSATIQREKHLM